MKLGLSDLSFRMLRTSRVHVLLSPRTIRYAYHILYGQYVEQVCKETDSWYCFSSLHVGGIPKCKTDVKRIRLVSNYHKKRSYWFCFVFLGFFFIIYHYSCNIFSNHFLFLFFLSSFNGLFLLLFLIHTNVDIRVQLCLLLSSISE